MHLMNRAELRDVVKAVASKLHLGPAHTEPPMVLVVDDEPPMVALVERILRTAGYETASASNGKEALEVYATLPKCDLLLTDFVMPNMSGQELSTRLHMVNPDLKVLYLTGHVDGLFEDRMLMWPAEAFLEKPFSAEGVLEAVALAISGNPHMMPER